MSKDNQIFWGKSKKELDKEKKLVQTEDTAQPETKSTVDFNPTYQAYSIIKLDYKKYDLVVVDIDVETLEARASLAGINADVEPKILRELQLRLAEQSRKFMKD